MNRRRNGFIHTSLVVLLALMLALSMGLVGCGGNSNGSDEINPGTTDQPGPTGDDTLPADDASANPFEEGSYQPTTTERNEALIALFAPSPGWTYIYGVDEPGDYEWLVDGPFEAIASGIISSIMGDDIPDLTPSYMAEVASLGVTPDSMGLPSSSPGAMSLNGEGWTIWGQYAGSYFTVTIEDASGFYDNEDGEYHERVMLYMYYGE
jgi:hypothetical protein